MSPTLRRNFPIPYTFRIARTKSEKLEYPFEELEKGDMFFFPLEATGRNRVSSMVTKVNKQSNWKFTVRTFVEEGKNYIGVWRIK